MNDTIYIIFSPLGSGLCRAGGYLSGPFGGLHLAQVVAGGLVAVGSGCLQVFQAVSPVM